LKFNRTSLIPLLLLPALLGGCSAAGDKSEPAPTVISNDEAIKQLGGKVAGETASPTESSSPSITESQVAPAPGTLSTVELNPETPTPENYVPNTSESAPPAP
jgi:hypothetical protein